MIAVPPIKAGRRPIRWPIGAAARLPITASTVDPTSNWLIPDNDMPTSLPSTSEKAHDACVDAESSAMDSNSNQLGRVRLAAGTTNAAGFADLFGSKPTNGSAVTKHPASNMITPV